MKRFAKSFADLFALVVMLLALFVVLSALGIVLIEWGRLLWWVIGAPTLSTGDGGQS